ncbi:GNAT family N-acetyltransferase [Glycomyces sp. TRM65418]|uniref:GNAT family N-acetyltransferase n=1 Tax=Glycomyces sp. TRM65418 TaxID=2867006 RepID=UPI001CE66515|nr:GNAT family N-acetyltransferase [Glycomyces sp. TRM65418]MCC3762609.1 GNAT family N-acetyltransferase [Glycomyces sp. TRM65418]QZD56647.1 GNAT family N-acetyltransferase [Glycomyces sp. TRM65418]
MTHTDLADRITATSYLPTLGPIHPHERRPELWQQVLDNNGTGGFLPFDKARVWGGLKQDAILTDRITAGDDFALVPVLDRSGPGTVDVYCYGNLDQAKPRGADLAAKAAADHGTDRARLKWFTTDTAETAADRAVRIQLKTFEPDTEPPFPGWGVDALTDQPPGARASFAGFAARAKDGFPFLASRLVEGLNDGPILTVRDLAQIVGAIGPMRILPDSLGVPRLLPQYFTVLPEHRGNGYGRSLWNAAMAWGHEHGAAYQLLQTEIGGASDRLCQSDGLASLSVLHTHKVAF